MSKRYEEPEQNAPDNEWRASQPKQKAEKNRMLKQRLALSVLVLLLAGLPLALVFFNVGPGRWANTVQDMVIGGHSLKLSILAVLFMEFWLIGVVGKTVRRLTGRTLVGLFAKRKPSE